MIHGSLIFGTFQAFLKACYTPENLPLKTFPDSVANFSSILKQVKVRGTSRELRPVATPQASASSNPMASGCHPGMSAMMEKIEQQARALDALKNQMSTTDRLSLPRASSSHSLDSDAASQVSSLMSPKALPSVDTLPLPAPPAHVAKDSGEPVGAPHNNDSHGPKSLEDYEQEAKDRITKKTAKEMDAKMPVLKRPSSKKAAKAEPKGKVTQSKKVSMKGQGKQNVTPAFLKGIYGCIRCRGTTKGCDTCRSPQFGGLRFSSREEYNKWYQKKQQGGTKRK